MFGSTINEQASFAVLDAFVAHGFNAIDTADVYSNWVPGNRGGESETIIGRWLTARPGVRDKVVLFTKVGWDLGRPGQSGLSRRWIAEAAEGSLARLAVDAIDVYFSHTPDTETSHTPDTETPYEETLAAYSDLLKAGMIKSIGASNHDAAQLEEAKSVAERNGLPRYVVVQPEYNLHDRASFEGALEDFSIAQGLGVVTYYSLASGFLTGKCRSETDLGQSSRGGGVARYLDDRGFSILKALDEVAATRGAKHAEVSLARLMARDGVTAPIASATSVSQLESFARSAALRLTSDEIAALDKSGG